MPLLSGSAVSAVGETVPDTLWLPCPQIDQAALTGESLPAKKFSGHVAFSGSTVKQGEKEALVYATGENTFFGRAAALISGTHNVANLQKIMTRIGGTCLITIGVWCTIELAVQFGRYHHVCHMGAGESLALHLEWICSCMLMAPGTISVCSNVLL